MLLRYRLVRLGHEYATRRKELGARRGDEEENYRVSSLQVEGSETDTAQPQLQRFCLEQTATFEHPGRT